MLAVSAFAQEQAAPKSGAPPASAPAQEKPAPARPPKTDSLKALEDNLFKPLQDSLNPDHSLDPPLVRPRINSPAQNKKLRDAIDRKKNWVFMTPEEMLSGGENPNELPDKDGKNDVEKDMTPMQRYMYQRLFPAKDSKANNLKEKRDPLDSSKRDPWGQKKDSYGNRATDDEDHKEDKDAERAKNAKEGDGKKDSDKTTTRDNEPRKRSTSIFSDIFGVSRPELTKEEERAEKARMDAFKQSLGLPITPTFDARRVSPYLALPDSAPPVTAPPKSVETPATASKPSGFGPQLGTIPTMPSLPSLTPSPVAQPFGARSPSLAPAVLPAAEPARILPPQPTFTAPKRGF